MDTPVTPKAALLQVLRSSPGYVLDLVERLNALAAPFTYSPFTYSLHSARAALRELERARLVESESDPPRPGRGGRPREHYRLTALGQEVAFGQQRSVLRLFSSGILCRLRRGTVIRKRASHEVGVVLGLRSWSGGQVVVDCLHGWLDHPPACGRFSVPFDCFRDGVWLVAGERDAQVARALFLTHAREWGLSSEAWVVAEPFGDWITPPVALRDAEEEGAGGCGTCGGDSGWHDPAHHLCEIASGEVLEEYDAVDD